MKIDAIVTIVAAVVKYDMNAADNKATEILLFNGARAYDSAIRFVNSRVSEFCKEFGIPKRLHDYGDDGCVTVHRDMVHAIEKQTDSEDVLLAESDTQDRLFARIEFHNI